MKAAVYHGPKKVSVDTVPDAKIEKHTDLVIRITTTNICGSDLLIHEGRTDVEKGKALGPKTSAKWSRLAVHTLKKGDRGCNPAHRWTAEPAALEGARAR